MYDLKWYINMCCVVLIFFIYQKIKMDTLELTND
mgnify:CR=1 FL=1